MKKIFIIILLTISLFINPHSYDNSSWYKSQINTGIGNCGPASVAMIIQRSGINVEVKDIRNLIGYKIKDGSTSIKDLLFILNQYYIDTKILKSIDQYYGYGILLILINTKYLSNKEYSYSGGHYIIIAGKTENYFIVNDPLSGPNKLYKISEIKSAILSNLIWIE